MCVSGFSRWQVIIGQSELASLQMELARLNLQPSYPCPHWGTSKEGSALIAVSEEGPTPSYLPLGNERRDVKKET